MTRVIVQDLRSVRYCLKGSRGWFARHGIDWGAFVSEGIEAERLLATGDALVGPAVQAAEARERRAGTPASRAGREATRE